MAGFIKGITIEFRGETTQLEDAIRTVSRETAKLDRELKSVDRALKFNPSNVDLWNEKQTLLTKKIDETNDKLKLLEREQQEMDKAGISDQSLEYQQLQREIIETESKLKHFKAQLREIGNVNLRALGEQFKQIGAKMTDMGKTLTQKVTVPLVAVGAVSAKKFAEVDKVMQLTNATMKNTSEQAELLDKAMKEAAANSTFGMNDAATATLNFARAGLTAEQAAATLAPAMNLAAGEGGNLETVSAGLVATINGFGDSFDNAALYADVFANACNNSALDIDTLSNAMSVAAPIFSAAGYSVNDAALFMGVMADKGIEADKAANSLKTGLARLVSPAKDGAAMMDKLGISLTNTDGTMKDTVTIQSELHDAFAQLSESEQIAAASAIFGKNQMAPWLALINTAPSSVEALNEKLGQTGTTTEMAGKMMSGFGGSIESLKSSLDVLATSFGQALAPILMKAVTVIQKLVDWFNNLSPAAQQVIAVIAVVAAAIGPLLVILGTVISSIGSVISFVGMIAPMVAGAATAIGGFVAAFLPVIAVIAAVVAAGVLLYKNWDKIKAKALEIKNKIISAWNSIKANVKAAANTVKSSVISAFSSLKARVATIWTNIKQAISRPMQSAVGIVRAAIAKIKSIMSTKISLPHIKLPHFNISGKLSLNPPSVPHLSVSWYKQGGIFDSPTIAGIGEAGPEAVVPLDKFWDKLDAMAAGSGTTIYVTNNINGADDPEEWGRRFVRQIRLEMRAT